MWGKDLYGSTTPITIQRSSSLHFLDSMWSHIFCDLKWQNAVTHLGGGKIFGFDHVPRLKGRGSIVPEIGGRPLTLPKQYDRATKFCTVITMEIVKFYEVLHVPIPRGGVPVTPILGPLWTAIPFELERQNTAYRDRHLWEVLRVNHVPA